MQPEKTFNISSYKFIYRLKVLKWGVNFILNDWSRYSTWALLKVEDTLKLSLYSMKVFTFGHFIEVLFKEKFVFHYCQIQFTFFVFFFSFKNWFSLLTFSKPLFSTKSRKSRTILNFSGHLNNDLSYNNSSLKLKKNIIFQV